MRKRAARSICKWFLVTTWLLCCQWQSFAQYQAKPSGSSRLFYLSGRISLDSLTRYVHATSGLRLAFSSARVKPNLVLEFPAKKYTLPQLLQYLKHSTALYVNQYHGYIVLTDKPVNTLPLQRKPAVPKISPPEKPLLPARVSQAGSYVHSQDSATIAVRPPPKMLYRRPPATKIPTSPTTGETVRASSSVKEWQFGLAWNLIVPVYGISHYFTGVNGREQIYQPLVPGVFVAMVWQHRHEVLLDIIPFGQLSGGNSLLADSTLHSIPGDTQTYRRTIRLIKSGGFAFGLHYRYSLTDHWQLAAGLLYQLQAAALLRQQMTSEATGQTIIDSTYSVKTPGPGNASLRNSVWVGRLELAYRQRAVSFGLAVLVPVNSIAGHARPLSGQLFLRWNLGRLSFQ